VRVALGASHGVIMRLVLADGMVLAALGTGAGLVAALGAARVISSLLYGVAPTDLAAFTTSGVVVMLVTLAATYIPARRALASNLLSVLRSE
jgi:ABC-type lipoprotein release transport system permease subunit